MSSSRLYKKIVFLFLVNILTTLNWVTAVSVAAGTTEEEHIEKCRLGVDGSGVDVPCAFPFTIKGKIYDGVCTNVDDPDNKYWCSTKTDSDGYHVRKNWAYCKEGCDKKPAGVALQTRTIDEGREHCAVTLSGSGSNPDTPCVFPFKFNGKVYNGRCTKETDPDGKYWCSTKTFKRGRRKGQHVPKGGHWGYCQEGCDIVPVERTIQSPETKTETLITIETLSTTERGTLKHYNQSKTVCTGIYCNERFWDINKDERKLRDIEEKQDSWGGFHRDTEAGDYLPNEFEDSCGATVKTSYIVGGVDAKYGEFPFIAALGYRFRRNKMLYKCGATMINRRYIITAAHCHSKTNPDNQIAEVVLGDHDLSTNPDCAKVKDATGELRVVCNNKPVQRFPITLSDVIVHENWDHSTLATEGNDIALIRLPKIAYTAREISVGVSVMPICLPWGPLPNGNVAEYPKETASINKYWVIGWGRTNNFLRDRGDTYEGGAHSNVLQKLNVTFIPVETCKEDFKAFSGLTTDRQVCAGGEQGKDSCQGDSGGPLMVRRDKAARMYLRGIVSFGTKRCGKGYPGVYTNVEHYIPWIKKNMRL